MLASCGYVQMDQRHLKTAERGPNGAMRAPHHAATIAPAHVLVVYLLLSMGSVSQASAWPCTVCSPTQACSRHQGQSFRARRCL